MRTVAIYAKTNMGFKIKKGEAAANKDTALFKRYQEGDISKHQLYTQFMEYHDLTPNEIDPDTLIDWMRWCGWKV